MMNWATVVYCLADYVNMKKGEASSLDKLFPAGSDQAVISCTYYTKGIR